jgi:putative thioredoxin
VRALHWSKRCSHWIEPKRRAPLSSRCFIPEAYEPALAQLLEIVRRDRKFGDDVGRKTMVEVFNLLGGQGDLVSTYRRLLSSALY